MNDKIEEREKIMQIVINHWFDDNSIQLEEIADEILTLIQEERKEAVRGLIEYLESHTDEIFYLGCGRIATEYLEIVEREKK